MSELPPANWYPDPEVPGQQRYWDGTQWTEHRAPGTGGAASDPAGTGSADPSAGGAAQQASWSQAPASSASQWGQQPGGQAYPGQPYQPASSGPANGMAIAALVLAIVWLGGIGSIAAVVLGLVALRQIREANGAQGGRGLAIAGTVIGGIGILGSILFWVVFAFLGAAVEQGSSEFSTFFECIEEETRTGQDLDC